MTIQNSLFDTSPQADFEATDKVTKPTRARRSDPVTSHIAYERMESEGVGTWHRRMIVLVLKKNGCKAPMTAGEIGACCGLTNVQVSRRLSELVNRGLIEMGKVLGTQKTHRKCRVQGTSCSVWRIR